MAKERRPSDYEPVLVRNVGFMSTEASHMFCASQTSSGGRGIGQDGDTEEDVFKLEARDLPPPNPMISNPYEVVKNLGFQSTGNSPPEESGGQPLSPSGIEVIKNESYSELPQPHDQKKLSISNNPMYSTGIVVRGKTGLKEGATTDDSNKGVNNETSLYEVPPDNPPSLQRPDRPQVNPNSSTYDVPSNNSLEKFSTEGVKNGNYDVPPNNPREKFSTEGVNNGTTNPAYDVPPNNPPGDIQHRRS